MINNKTSEITNELAYKRMRLLEKFAYRIASREIRADNVNDKKQQAEIRAFWVDATIDFLKVMCPTLPKDREKEIVEKTNKRWREKLVDLHKLITPAGFETPEMSFNQLVHVEDKLSDLLEDK